MDILEIGAGTGSTTEAVLKGLGDQFSSYMYTDISAGFFLQAQSAFSEHASKMSYKVFDATKAPSEQSFSEHSYDLMIASNVLHATPNLEETLANIRKLLKPGGYLVMLEVTNTEPLRPTFFFGCLPGWWVGEADGRSHHPLVTRDRWSEIFQKTGFSGLDSATPEHNVFMAPFSVMLSQAIDPKMSMMRQPLQAEDKIGIDNLLVLGGANFGNYQTACDITSKLKHAFKEITIVETLEVLTEEHFNPKQTVLSLLELDGPVFEPFTSERFKALQLLTARARNVLWVVQGISGDQPYSNMMLGVARCLVGEQPEMQFQVIDFDIKDAVDTNFVAESMMRLIIADGWRSSAEPYRPVWNLEREIRYLDGSVHIPRYIPSTRRNLQYNSWRRTIRESIDPQQVPVSLVNINGTHDLEQHTTPHPGIGSHEWVDISTLFSSTKAIDVGAAGHLFVATGKAATTGQPFLVFAESNASKLVARKGSAVSINKPVEDHAQLIRVTAEVCLSRLILERAPETGSLLVHEPSLSLARILTTETQESNSNVIFTTTKRAKTASGLSFKFVHAAQADHSIARMLRENITAFVDAADGSDSGAVGARVSRQLSPNCKRIILDGFLNNASTAGSSTTLPLNDILGKSLAYYHKSPDSTESLEALSLETAVGASANSDTLQVVDWKSHEHALVRMSPVEDEVTFKEDKTYLLVGLSGELGRSLCHWMVKRGAKNVVLTSRKPNVEQAWLGLMASYGARVEVIAMDVTDKRSVFNGVQQVKATLPPVVGVANGAMVLNDGLFNTISHAEFDGTLRPKVAGTVYLNQLFDKPDLDFFITFSSLAYVTGNFGQTSYAAANAFMTSVVEGRRKRGLAGSVMHLAGIFGIGYITRTDRAIIERLGKLGYANISEYDFHQFFAEAVLAGLPESGRCFEVGSALRPIDPEQEDNPPSWLDMPRLAYYKVIDRAGIDESENKAVSVRAQLLEQTSMADVTKVMTNGLIAKLYKQLGLSPEDDSISPDTSLVDLGIDSLVAVDLRFWFTKELDLDMPVLKLLGGATIAEMVEDTIERINSALIPNVKGDEAPATTESTAQSTQPAAPESAPETSSEETATHPLDEAALDASTEKTDEIQSSMEESGSNKEGAESSNDMAISSRASETSITDSEDKAATLAKLRFLRKVRMGYGPLQFFFMVKHLDDPTILNMQFRLPLKGLMRTNDLDRAARTLGQRHEALRTAFFVDPENEEPTQGVLESSGLRLETFDVSDEAQAYQICDQIKNEVFDIEHGQTLRILLLSMSPTSHLLVFAFHHISIDGFSFNILLDELNAAYQGQRLPPVKTHFTDVMYSQRKDLEAGLKSSELSYWREALGRIPDAIPLFPVANVSTRLPLTKYQLEQVPMAVIDATTAQKIRKQCAGLKATKFQFFVTVLRQFLFAFLDTDELCIGFADANRSDPNVFGTVGYLVNMLSLRFQRQAGQTFKEKIEDAKKKSYAALANSTVPFNALLDKLDAQRSATYTPVFQVFIDYIRHNFPAPKGLGVIEEGVSAQLTHNFFDLAIDINDVTGNEIYVRFGGQQYLYCKPAVQFLLDSYIRLVRMCADKPVNEKIDKPNLYDPQDVGKVLDFSRGEAKVSNWPPTALQRIEQVSAANPDVTALSDYNDRSMSYGEMITRSEEIASCLAATPIKPQDIVGVHQEPNMDTVASILAIWRLGAVYVPLDTRVALSRLRQIVDDCEPSAIICHERTHESATELCGKDVIVVDISDDATAHSSSAILAFIPSPDDTAVVLYTSGSTGTPKGLPIRHISLLNQMESMTGTFGVGSEVVLQQSAASFDVAMQQTLMCLCNGGTLHIASQAQRLDPLEITKMIVLRKITWVHATPSELTQWLRHGSAYLSSAPSLRFIFSSGEALTGSLVRDLAKLNKPDLRLVNVYGPAEAGVVTGTEIDYAHASADSRAPVSLGRPLSNIAVYVIDREMRPVPAGVSGEIVIAGAGNIPGYLNRAELSAKSFTQDPLTPNGHYPGQSMTLYRSGDLGRYDQEGQLYFKGRIAGDLQVKVNGIRVELEDIECSIVEAAGGAVTNAVVVDKHDPDFLVAFVEFVQEFPEAEKGQFLALLQQRLPLPRCMCPAILVPTRAIPLTSHGKLDRRAIAAFPLPTATAEEDGPLSETEAALKELWADCLPDSVVQATNVTSSSDFFRFGGNSYLLVRLQQVIRRRFNVYVPVMTLYDSSVLASMARKIDSGESVVSVDWEAETDVTQALMYQQARTSTTQSVASHNTKSDLTVVLTGATGYLGSRIRKALAEDDRISTIHCVALREYSQVSSRDVSMESPKLRLHAGNFEDPMLGLDSDVFDLLAGQADLIIHSGANRAFWDYYENLRDLNVTPTKSLVNLAARRKMPIHFISSGGVHLLNNNTQYRPESVAATPPPTDGSNGYIASKWASEVYLEKAAKQLGIPVSIHRFVPAEMTTDTPPMELMEELQNLALQLKALPVPSGWTGTFDLTLANALASDLVTRAVDAQANLSDPAKPSTVANFFHYSSQVKLSMEYVAQFMDMLPSDVEGNFERLPPLQWAGRAKKAGLTWHFTSMDFAAMGGVSGVGLRR